MWVPEMVLEIALPPPPPPPPPLHFCGTKAVLGGGGDCCVAIYQLIWMESCKFDWSQPNWILRLKKIGCPLGCIFGFQGYSVCVCVWGVGTTQTFLIVLLSLLIEVQCNLDEKIDTVLMRYQAFQQALTKLFFHYYLPYRQHMNYQLMLKFFSNLKNKGVENIKMNLIQP